MMQPFKGDVPILWFVGGSRSSVVRARATPAHSAGNFVVVASEEMLVNARRSPLTLP